MPVTNPDGYRYTFAANGVRSHPEQFMFAG